jgi:adenosylcobinamide-phosphate synthase
MLLLDALPLLAALLLALALDALLGDPAWLYRRIPHPVAAIGRLLAALEARWLDPAASPPEQRRRGRRAVLLLLALAAATGLALQQLCLLLPHGWLALGVLMSTALAWRGLHEHVQAVASALDHDLAAARRAVAHIVGRDPESLDRPAIARAAIESTAESFADGVIAPLVWGLVLGLPGMLVYKTINTADSMIGHRTPRLLHFGRFAARLDDAANWLPARLAALLLLLAACLTPDTSPAAAWRALRRDPRHHRSPNAGWPEAAMAGALGLRLAGPRRYAGMLVPDAWMGTGRAAATPADIRQALRLLARATLLAAVALALALLAAHL